MGGVSKKKKSKKTLLTIFHINTWKLVLVLILLVFLSATLLRFDHIKMTELREAVLAADEQEDDAKTISALNELHTFTLKHIIFNILEDNGKQSVIFGTGPFYLENLYIRDAKEAIAKQQAEIEKQGTTSKNPNGNIYRQVADICDAQGKRYGWAYPDPRYINCWQDELAKFPSSEELQSQIIAQIPSAELYEYEFASPYWYPCASGFAILACAILVLLILIRIIIWFGYKILIFAAEHAR